MSRNINTQVPGTFREKPENSLTPSHQRPTFVCRGFQLNMNADRRDYCSVCRRGGVTS